MPAAPDDLGVFDEQIAYLRGKLNLPTERWDDIWQSAHDRAFVVAGALKADLLQDLHLAVERGAAGAGFAAFKRDFGSIVTRHGWSGWTGEGSAAGRAWRAAIIYDTNLSASHAAGRWRQLQALVPTLPYWRYRHADGVLHPRPLHLAWHGLTLRHDHPFWRTHFPPNGWGCHCKVFAEATPAEGAPTEPPPGWEAGVGVDEGWGHAPGSRVGVPLREMVESKLITYPPAISRALSHEAGRYIRAETDVAAFATQTLAQPQAAEQTLWLGFVRDPERLAEAAAADLTGYTLTLPSSAVHHVQRQHGRDGGSQRPPTPADYAQLEAIVNSPAHVAGGDRPGVITLWGAWAGGEQIRTVWTVLSGRRSRTLALRTLYVKTQRGAADEEEGSGP